MSLEQSDNSSTIRWVLVALFLIGEFALVGYGIKGSIPPSDVRKISGYSPWSEEVVEAASTIPVQSGGRVKPLSTFARFEMLSLQGAVSIKVESGGKKHKITATEWLLDCLFRPELAHNLPIFRIDDSEVIHRYGIIPKDRRARLSYNDLLKDYGKGADGKERLIQGAQAMIAEEEKLANQRVLMTPKQIENMENSRTPDEIAEDEKQEREGKTIKELAQHIRNYEALTSFLDFARIEITPPAIPEAIFGDDGRDSKKFSTWIKRWNQLRVIFMMSQQQGVEIPEDAHILAKEVEAKLNLARYGIKWLPHEDPGEEEWRSIGGHIIELLEDPKLEWQKLDEQFAELDKLKAEGTIVPDELKSAASFQTLMRDMESLEKLVGNSNQPNSPEFLASLKSWRDEVTTRANARDEGSEIEGEVSYYKRKYFQYALVFFIIAFVISAFGWIITEGNVGKGIRWATTFFYIGAFLYLAMGIFHRSVLMGRPPVGNLYDTIPFITAGATLVLGIAEWLTKRKLLISLGSALGIAGLFLAFRYEVGDAKDHMDPLVAVLKSNYWLATHVVTVTLGYSGGLMAFAISLVYVHLRLMGVIENDRSFRRFITRAVYGIICFTLLFSLVGTVLGGIWANDSWGRFWGWDPKENGALLIVLWTLIILHSRLAGWIQDWGIHLASIFGGAVVAFSWWHVNMLEVGLHSYGFIKGGSVIWLFYIAAGIALAVGVAGMILERVGKRDAQAQSE